MTPARLQPTSLTGLPRSVRLPRFDREPLRAGIVHLGLGAFMRGHLAAFNDDALDAGAARNWGIVGVSLRHADTRDALGPQRGLYTLALRDADERGVPCQQLRLIGCVREVLVAPEDPATVLARLPKRATATIRQAAPFGATTPTSRTTSRTATRPRVPLASSCMAWRCAAHTGSAG
jgi:fructuronate reductase